MAVELIPAILATTSAQLKRRAVLAQRLGRTVHLDVMDGKFVATRSVGWAAIQRTRWRKPVEIHAMVKNPDNIRPWLLALHPKRVYFPAEIGAALLPMIVWLRSQKIEFGLAINPTISSAVLSPFIRYAKSVLVMTVKPGRYHAPYQPKSLRLIKTIRRRWPNLIISCDGGMNPRTMPQVISAGAQRIIVGSDVMLNDNPLAEWRSLQRLTSG